MSLITFIFFVILLFAVLVPLIGLYTRRIMDGALTDHFRAAEAISDGRIPDKWVVQIQQQIRRGRLKADFEGTEVVLAKLDKLYGFFEKSSYFEDEDVREMLLTQFQETRRRWSEMTWEALVVEYEQVKGEG